MMLYTATTKAHEDQIIAATRGLPLPNIARANPHRPRTRMPITAYSHSYATKESGEWKCMIAVSAKSSITATVGHASATTAALRRHPRKSDCRRDTNTQVPRIKPASRIPTPSPESMSSFLFLTVRDSTPTVCSLRRRLQPFSIFRSYCFMPSAKPFLVMVCLYSASVVVIDL
jgi:hypothetical protein